MPLPLRVEAMVVSAIPRVVLDEPISSALLRAAIESELVTCDVNLYELAPRELAKGLSPAVQERAFLSLVLFDEVVIPGDKAMDDVGVDWSRLVDAAGLTIPNWITKDRVRESALGRLYELDVSTDAISGWDRVLHHYLAARRHRLSRRVLESISQGNFLRTIAPYLLVGTLEERVLFITDAIEWRIDRVLEEPIHPYVSDLGGPEGLRQAIWLVEAYFHLRYLHVLASESEKPGLVWTSFGGRSLPAIDPRRMTGIVDSSSERVYSIVLDQVPALPRPASLRQALALRTDPLVVDFREYFHRWRDAVSQGDVTGERELRSDLARMSSRFDRLKVAGEVARSATYAGVLLLVTSPVTGPLGVIAGGAVTVVGSLSQAWADVGAGNARWMALGSR